MLQTLSHAQMFLAALAALTLAAPAMAQEQGEPDGDDPSRPVSELVITARRLDAARANVDPALGASTYAVTTDLIESRPGNEAVSLAKVLLQFPGVQTDGSGQLRIRQSQGDLQYRINNVIIPDGASDLGESLSARIAQKVVLVTGALPAQYGFQTGGVVSVTTKSGAYLDGGQLEGYGGGRGEGEAAFELGAASGPGNAFVSGSFHRNPVGRAALDGSGDPFHDRADQVDGFAYLDRVLGPQTRIGLILGISDDRFQIPTVRGLASAAFADPRATYQGPLTLAGTPSLPSQDVADRSREANRFAVASLMRSGDKLTLQFATFARQSVVSRRADGAADLLFKGVGYTSDERAWAVGLQAEAVYELAEAHTVRAGLQFSDAHQTAVTTVTVLPVGADGRQATDVPRTLSDRGRGAQSKTSLFAQDEWRLTSDVTLNWGGRLDLVGGQGGVRAFSPRASLVWTLPSGAIFHAGYARYVLPAPLDTADASPSELAGTTGATPTMTSAGLRSEHDDYVDAGLQNTSGGLTLGLDAYARWARDLIAEGEFGPAGLPAAFNYAHARIVGAEVSAAYQRGPLTGWANLAISKGTGRALSSNQALFTAMQLSAVAAHDTALREDQRITGSGGVSWRKGRLVASTSLVVGSGLPRTLAIGAVNGAHLPAYAQVDFTLDYRLDGWKGRPLEVRLDLVNAFDARYQLRDGSGLGDGQPAWGPRRGMFVGLEQTF